MSIEVSGQVVDNGYNNFLTSYDVGGRLVRVGNKLYYNYAASDLSYGLIEISDEGTRRIFWQGYRWLGACQRNTPIRQWQGNLLMLFDGTIYTLPSDGMGTDKADPLTEEGLMVRIVDGELVCMVRDDAFDQLENTDLTMRKVDGDLLYTHRKNASTDTMVYKVEDGLSVPLVTLEDAAVYLTDSDVYYLKEEHLGDDQWEYEIARYDVGSGASEVLYRSRVYDGEKEMIVTRLLVESDHLFFYEDTVDAERIYQIDLGDDDHTPVSIYEGDFDGTWNAYDGVLYFSDMDVIKKYDIRSGEVCDIADLRGGMATLEGGAPYAETDRISRLHIVDDTWVYFVVDRSVLWRVKQDGSALEKVYG